MGTKHLLQNLLARSKAFDPASQQFLSVDRGAIERDLDLKNRAEQDGKNNIPKSDVTEKDALATDIDAHMTEVLSRGKSELQDHLQAIGALDTVQSPDEQITELKTTTLMALNTFYAICKNGVNDLYPLKRVVADGELAYEKFKKQNNLDRPCHYPENRFRELWWIALFLVGEALFNTWTLGSAHPEGPLGVFRETVIIALVNVVMGFVISYFWRQTYHINKIRAFFGHTVAVAIAVPPVLAFNFVIGHYRDALVGLQTQATGTDVESYFVAFANIFRTTIEKAFSYDFWAFGGLMSILLIFVGIGIAVATAIKAFSLDDRYPGYGRESRAQDKRNADYAVLSAHLQDELQNTGNNTSTTITEIFDMGQAHQNMVRSHEQTITTLISKYQSWISELKTVGTALYANYRQNNEQYRTEPPPPAFQIDFSIPDDMVAPPARPQTGGNQNIERLLKLKDSCITIVNEANNMYLGVYQTIGALAPENAKEKRVNTYDVEVEKINNKLQKRAQKRGIADQPEKVNG